MFCKDDSTPAATPLRAVSTIRFDVKRFGFYFSCAAKTQTGQPHEPMMESPEVLREPAIAVPQSHRDCGLPEDLW